MQEVQVILFEPFSKQYMEKLTDLHSDCSYSSFHCIVSRIGSWSIMYNCNLSCTFYYLDESSQCNVFEREEKLIMFRVKYLLISCTVFIRHLFSCYKSLIFSLIIDKTIDKTRLVFSWKITKQDYKTRRMYFKWELVGFFFTGLLYY